MKVVRSVQFENVGADLVIVRLPPLAGVGDVKLWFDELERRLEEARRPIALVHDLSASTLSSIAAANRQATAEQTSRLVARSLAPKIAADARVFNNAIVAGAVRAVSWLTGTTPWPQGNFSTESEAIAWARAELAKGR